MDASDDSGSENQDDVGLSLEELSQTYAQIMSRGAIPYGQTGQESPPNQDAQPPTSFDPKADELIECDDCPISPQSILEAVLFVGTTDGKPTTADEVASIMRGVRSQEVDLLVEELNEAYEQGGHAMRIVVTGGGYRMQLADELLPVRERFYGRVRETRLNQSAVDCLALIAYRPGITREEIDDQRSRSSGSILNQLVRRNLVEMRREGEKKKTKRCFYPSERLLRITGLASLDELPQVEDWN